MGYYTWYRLEVGGQYEEKFHQDFQEGRIYCQYGNLRDIFEYQEYKGYREYTGFDSMKWYESTEDMTMISKSYPNTLFVLHGDGEDHEDFWRGYFRNGEKEVIYAKIVYDEPSEAILTNDVDVTVIESEIDARSWM